MRLVIPLQALAEYPSAMPDLLAEHLKNLPADAWVLTETVWQARALQSLLAQAALVSGDAVWQRPFIVPWEQAWPMLWDRLPFDLPQRLSALQEQSLWRKVIQASHPDDWLLDADRSARMAQQARRILLQWREDEQDPFQGPLSEEAEYFQHWHRAYEQALLASAWVDRAALPHEIVSRLMHADASQQGQWQAHLPSEIALYGVDLRSPQRQRLQAALCASGVQFQILPQEQASAQAAARQVECADAEEERLRAAQWLRRELERVSNAIDTDHSVHTAQHLRGKRWLWVVPDLAQSRHAVERVLRQVLQPNAYVNLQSDLAPLWRIGVAQKLSDIDAIQALMHLLRLAQGEISLNDFGGVLRSPWWVAEVEAAAAIALDVRFRTAGEPMLQLEAVAPLLADCPRLQTAMDALLQGPAAIRGVQSTALWAEHFDQFAREQFWAPLLERSGEDAPRVHALSQWRDVWNEALDQLAALQAMESPPSYGAAVQLLARCAESMQLPDAVSEAPIWVCTPQDAAAIPTDGIWVSGMREDRWLAAQLMHPMLPITWARNLPLYQKQAVLAQAEDQIAQWRRAGAMFSWPAYEGETELAAVTAIADLPKEAYPSAPSVLQSLQGKLVLEQIADRPVPLSAPQLRGGASAFTHQALCPFRGFVRVRLGVRSLEEGHGGLNARERGIVLHRALQNFWQAFAPEQRTQGSLLRLSAQERSERITQAVERALHKLQTTRALTLSGRFLAHEQMRLQQALEKLIALDLDPARAAFTLIEIEDRRKVEFAGLQLHVQRDRVEEIDGHGRVVMDYKTGLVSASNWHGDRPKDLQLPLYAVLEAREGHALAGVLFAQFREGDWKFAGEVSTAGLFPTRAQSKRKPLDFSEALPVWESALNALADELRQGVARVDPQASACQFCGLQAACRIDPWQQDQDMEVGADDSETGAFV